METMAHIDAMRSYTSFIMLEYPILLIYSTMEYTQYNIFTID